MTFAIDYSLKTQIICEYNQIPYNIKHQEAIQQIDTFIDTFPNYHTIASQGIPIDERYQYDKLNDQWSKLMDFNNKTITITNTQIIITSK